MKRCPKCKRSYEDDTLRFCLEDGSPLFDLHGSEAPATEILPADTATEIMQPRSTPTLKSSGPTVPSYSADAVRPRESETRSSNSALTFGVIAIAVLLLALVGIAGVWVLRQSGDSGPAVKESSPAANDQKRATS